MLSVIIPFATFKKRKESLILKNKKKGIKPILDTFTPFAQNKVSDDSS